MIKFGSVSLLVAAVIAGGLSTPALASEGEVTRLIERPDGTLAVETVKDGLFNKAFTRNKILAEQREEVETFTAPLEEVSPAEETGVAATRANDDVRWDQWGLDFLKAEQAWEYTQGEGITVAVLDTGINVDHPDFEGRATRGFTTPEATPGDQNGHGTHVAGVIAAGANNHLDMAGLAPKVKIWEGKITYDSGRGTSTMMAAGITHAINAGVDAINISMTSNSDMPLVHTAIVEAKKRGIPVFAAAGNDKDQGSPARWPAAYDEVIAVGALQQDGTYATFSNTNDYVDVTAPGRYIVGLNKNSGILHMSGTSQATPMVSASYALIKAANPNMSSDNLINTLLSTTQGQLKHLNLVGALNQVAPAPAKPQPLAEAPVSYNPAPAQPQPAPAPAPAPVQQPVARPFQSLSAPAPAPAPAPQPQPLSQTPKKPNAPKPLNPVRHYVRPER